jgi:hypothetical protein
VETAARRSELVERLGAVPLSSPALGFLLAALTWPIQSQAPSVGTDASWVAGLYMALGEGLQFGTQFVFTYGPLGFLEHPAFYDGDLWILAFLYRGLVYAALASALLWAARRAMPLPLAVAVVYGLLVVGYLEPAAVLLTLLVCLAALSDRPPARAAYLLAVGGGILAGVELLGKLNFGLTILALCLLTLCGVERRRLHVPLFVGVFFATLTAGWIGTGQSLGNFPQFVANGLRILGGYSDAMGADISAAGWQRPWAIAAAMLLVGAAALAGLGKRPTRQALLIALVGLFAFAMFKQCFVRQGLGNGSDFFPLMLGAAIALAPMMPRRPGRLPKWAPVGTLLVPLAILTVLALPNHSLWRSLQPADHVEYLQEGLRALARPSEREALAHEGAANMVSIYRVDRKTLGLLSGRRVDVEPWEIGAAWAYDLDWQPLPVIQGYQAYTSPLDSLNADALASPGRPEAILRQNTMAFADTVASSIDRRFESWDPPATARSMLCHYRSVRTTYRWQILYPTPDRCGTPQLLKRVEMKTGATVRVPVAQRDHIVFASVSGLGVEGLERLRATLYRAHERWATVDGDHSWRVVPGTAEDGLILSAGKGADFAHPFALAPGARSLSLRVAGTERRIAISLYNQAVRPIPRR